MKNPFASARSGFDSIIGAGMLVEGKLTLAPSTITVIDGFFFGKKIETSKASTATQQNQFDRTTLVINGECQPVESIDVPNVTITGRLSCTELIVSGVLAIKNGAQVTAERILYNTLVVETGAIVNARLEKISAESTEAISAT